MSAARLLLSGYYGFDNFGDDAILEIFTSEWRNRRPQDTLCVLSAKPSETARTYGVDAILRTSVSAFRAELARCNVFVSGGGGLLQSSTSLRSLFYYAGLLHEAKRAGRAAVIFDQGVGPLSFTAKQIVRRSCDEVDLAIVRDSQSAALLASLLPKVDVRLGADPVFLAPDIPGSESERGFVDEGIAPDATLVAVVVRPSRLLDRMADEIAEAIDLFAARYGVQVVLIPFQRPMDVEAAVSIIRRCKSAPVLLNGNYSVAAMSALFRRCSAVVAMRLHALILAARLGVPFLAIAYDPKVSALVESLGYPLPPLGAAATPALVMRLWAERESLAAALAEAVKPIAARAAQSFDWLSTVVEGAVS